MPAAGQSARRRPGGRYARPSRRGWRRLDFVHYETSAFACPAIKHSTTWNYWTFGDYLGIGAGAHGKLSFHDRIQRDMRHKQPAAYLAGVAQGSQVQTNQPVAHADLAFEFMMNALRLTEGFALSLFNERTGLPLSTILPALEQAQTRGWVQRDGD